MSANPWNAATQLFRLAGVVIALGWAFFLVRNGWGMLSSPDPGEQRGGFEMVGFGGLLLMIALVSGIYHAMKLRAPAKLSERPTEAEDVTFDADAALERYLARKAAQDHGPDLSAAPPAPPASQRPVFGRRGTSA